MKSKDQILLEQAYQKILLKEDPDEVMFGDAEIGSGTPGALTFGFINVGSKPFVVDYNIHGDTVFKFEGFEDTNVDKLIVSKKIHTDITKDLFKGISTATKGTITFLDGYSSYVNKQSAGFDEGDVIDMSDPSQRESSNVKAFFHNIINAPETLGFNVRQFLEPAGRAWVRSPGIKEASGNNIDSIISFWAEQDKVTPEHYHKLITELKLVPENTMVEFLGDSEPEITLDKLVGSSPSPIQPEMSDEEKEEREKRKADSMAKVHAASATGTKDKDVQDIIDQRKKAMSDRESHLRASGVRPSLAQRQQAMSSESHTIFMKNKDQILLEQAYQKVVESHREMTPKQEETYSRLAKAGYEFDYWDRQDVVMTRRERGMEYSKKHGSLAILPSGETFPLKDEDDVEYGDRIADEGI